MLTLMNRFISDTSMVSNLSTVYRAATWAWVIASPGTMLFVSIGTRRVVDLEPRMHIMADRNRLTLMVVPSHTIVEEYVSPCFSARNEARCCKKVVVSRLAPPDVEKISSMKEARSTSWTRSSFCSFVSLVYRGEGSGTI